MNLWKVQLIMQITREFKVTKNKRRKTLTLYNQNSSKNETSCPRQEKTSSKWSSSYVYISSLLVKMVNIYFPPKKKPKYQFATFTAATIGNNNTPMMSCETLNSCRFRENFKLIRLFNNDDERWWLRSIFVAHMGDSMKLLLAD